MAAPTYTHKPIPANPGPEDNLGGQVVDANRVAVQGLGSGFVTTDISASPIVSPATLTSAVTTVTPPNGAIRMTILNNGATNPLLFSELVGMATNFSLAAGVQTTIDIGRMGAIYFKSTLGTTMQFFFSMVD